MNRFDCLRSAKDTVLLFNATVNEKEVLCGLAYVEGNIPTQQALMDERGNQICSIYIPLDYANSPLYSLLSSTDDDVPFTLVFKT